MASIYDLKPRFQALEYAAETIDQAYKAADRENLLYPDLSVVQKSLVLGGTDIGWRSVPLPGGLNLA